MLRFLALSLCLNSLSLFNVLSANEIDINFPKRIVYKIFDDKDQYVGKCVLKFYKRGTKRTGYKTSLFRLGGLEGFGFSSDESLFTDIYKTDLSIYSIIILGKKGTRVPTFEARVIQGEKILKYRNRNNPIEETALLLDYPTIDISSSFLLASRMVYLNRHEQNFNFLKKENVKPVKFITLRSEFLTIGNKKISVVPVVVFDFSQKEIKKRNLEILY
jgi:hypothetical protein